ncbi:MAG TPA: carbohydrate ABC transporter permease [Chloroflexota bacterium]|nr:carbohydrate ABC transporter permease [Chloroflexota bacterium]
MGTLQLTRSSRTTLWGSQRFQTFFGKSLTYLLLVVGGATMLIPFIYMVSTALKTGPQVFLFPPVWIPSPIQWSNFGDAWSVIGVRTFVNTVFFAASIVFGQGLVTTMGGYGFARLKFPWREQLFLAYLGTMMIPSQVTMIPAYLVVVKLGWQNSYQGMIIPILASGAFGTFLFRQFFMQIPNELPEAAIMDGASHVTIFTRLFLPLSKPALVAYGVITLLNAWNMFVWPLIIIQSEQLWVLTLALSILQGELGSQMNVMMAGVTLSILPLLLLYIFGQRLFVEGVTMTGIKG